MKSMTENQDIPFHPTPREEWTLLCQGAEARIWKLAGNSDDGTVPWICKERFSKSYRHPTLDERLTKSRCRSEARILEKCGKRTQEFRVPKVIRVDPPLLYLEYLDGPSLKDYWMSPRKTCVLAGPRAPDTSTLARSMGCMIGNLHSLGVIHGDLTTSNMILLLNDDSQFELALIDFGLAKSTTSAEEQAVDLYVLERALQSTHPDLPEDFFDSLLKAYASTVKTSKNSQGAIQRLEQVRLRGRKRECFG